MGDLMAVDEYGDVMQLISSLSRAFRLLVEVVLVLVADAMMEITSIGMNLMMGSSRFYEHSRGCRLL